jgi:glycosyltransferase involved in cell wall biosynthesis
MKILVTGNYDPQYNRNRIVIKGLRDLKQDFIEYPQQRLDRAALKFIESSNCDVIYLPAFTHKDVLKLSRSTSKPIVFDPLISRYLTKVFDYKKFHRFSPQGIRTFLSDKRIFRKCDILIADTAQHANYYQKTFGVPPQKIRVIPVGADCDDFEPTSSTPDKVKIGFYGSFNPLQGIDKIIKAAALLPQHLFEIIGGGYVEQDVRNLIKALNISNVDLLGWLPYDSLNRTIQNHAVCLGIFGDTLKAPMVIPNKIFHYAACGKPIITADSPAIREIFSPEQNILLCRSNPECIAKTIEETLANPKMGHAIGANARSLIEGKYNCTNIAKLVISACQAALHPNS